MGGSKIGAKVLELSILCGFQLFFKNWHKIGWWILEMSYAVWECNECNKMLLISEY